MLSFIDKCAILKSDGWDVNNMTLLELDLALTNKITQEEVTRNQESRRTDIQFRKIAESYVEYSDYKFLLFKTNNLFWVGVKEGLYNSDPVGRTRTRCFSPKPVYKFANTRQHVFECNNKFYYIPESEMWAVQ